MTSDEIRKFFSMKVNYTTEVGHLREVSISEYLSSIENYLSDWLYSENVDKNSKYPYLTPIYNSLVKDGKFIHYMYPWSKDEVKEMNEYILELYKFYLTLSPKPNSAEYYSGFNPMSTFHTEAD